MGIGAAVGGAIIAAADFIGGAGAAASIGLATAAGTATTLGTAVGGALAGAAIGAGGAAITGGNIGIGALTGGLTGGLGGAGAGAALGSSLGVGAGVGNALIGAGVGALGSGLSGGNILTGALTGGAAGYLTGAAGNALGGASAAPGQADVDAFYGTGVLHPQLDEFGNAQMVGSTGTPPIPPKLGPDGQPIPGSYGDGSAGAMATHAAQENALNPQSAISAAVKSDSISSGSGGGSSDKSQKSTLDKILSSPLALGALSGLSTLLSPKQQTPTLGPSNTVGPANSTNLGPMWNQPLLRIAPDNTRQFVDPNINNYYTYGQMPGAQFFSNNNLRAYGFADGGQPEFNTAQFGSHVRGPGTGTSDEIPALLSNGEYVLTAKEVSALGRGDNDRGANVLDYSRKHGALASLVKGAA